VGRSLRDLIGLLDDLKARGVAFFRSLTEAIDTATPTGRAMWQMMGNGIDYIEINKLMWLMQVIY